MTNSVFIDSSLLIEYAKGKKTKLLASLIQNDSTSCFINETVISEFYFQFLKLSTGKAPATVQSSSSIASTLYANKNYRFIQLFEFLTTERTLITYVPELMIKYNLLPNDAIILATCKIHDIKSLASHDADFIIPCKAEGIELLRED